MKKFDYIFIGGLALWIFETACFGWNEAAGSVAEKMFDTASLCLIVYGGLGGLIRAARIEINIHGGAKINSD